MKRVKNKDVVHGFKILDEIIRTDFVTHYRTYREGDDTELVLKLFSEKACKRVNFNKMLFRNLEKLLKNPHKHIVPILDYGLLNNRAYVIEQSHQNLDGILQTDGPFSIEESLGIVQSAASALQHAWNLKIVHGNVCPSNIFILPSGNIALNDFGVRLAIKACIPSAQNKPSIKQATYQCPESVLRQPLTPRSDLYSLGVVLFELLVGNPPFQENHAHSILAKHANASFPALPERLFTLQALLDRMVSKEPSQRYPSAAWLHDAIKAEMSTRAICAGPASFDNTAPQLDANHATHAYCRKPILINANMIDMESQQGFDIQNSSSESDQRPAKQLERSDQPSDLSNIEQRQKSLDHEHQLLPETVLPILTFPAVKAFAEGIVHTKIANMLNNTPTRRMSLGVLSAMVITTGVFALNSQTANSLSRGNINDPLTHEHLTAITEPPSQKADLSAFTVTRPDKPQPPRSQTPTSHFVYPNDTALISETEKLGKILEPQHTNFETLVITLQQHKKLKIYALPGESSTLLSINTHLEKYPDDERVQQEKSALAATLLNEAKAANKISKIDTALERAALALRISPSNSDAKALREKAKRKAALKRLRQPEADQTLGNLPKHFPQTNKLPTNGDGITASSRSSIGIVRYRNTHEHL